MYSLKDSSYIRQINLHFALTGCSAGCSVGTHIKHHQLWPMVVLLQEVRKEHEKCHPLAISGVFKDKGQSRQYPATCSEVSDMRQTGGFGLGLS